mgnify:CR=1 FL=1
MAGFVNPMDLLREYLVPPTGAINTGMEQGLKLRTLENAEALEKAISPFRQAQTSHLNAQSLAIPITAQREREKLALDKIKESLAAGIPMNNAQSQTLTGLDLPIVETRQEIPDIRTEGKETFITDPSLKPAGLMIRSPQIPIPLSTQQKREEILAQNERNRKTTEATIEAARIRAGRETGGTNTVNNWIAESLEKDAAGNPTPNAIQAKLKIEVASKIDKERKQTASEEAKEELAQSLARGDMTRIRDVMSLRSSGGGATALEIFNRARQINPKFSTAEIERKIKMESDYTTGKDGQSIQAFGTFLEHAGATNQAIDAIQMTSSPLVNKPINWLRKNATGDPNFQAFMVSLEPVRKEFEGFLLGGRALYAEDRKAAETILNESSSPAQVKSALKQMGHTAKARFNELNYRYRKTMGQDIQEPFSPEAIKAATSLGVDLIGKAPNSKQPKWDNKVPQAAIDYLKAHPEQAAAFDAKYGNGNKVSQHFLGEK